VRSARLAGAEVVGVAASSPERAREAAAGLGVPHAYGSSEEAVAADGVDVVHICTPNDLHAPLAAAALAAGKHVVCEKPLATTAAEAERVLAAADATDRVATVPFVYRYNAMVFEARARVAAGGIGTVRLVHGGYLQDWLSTTGASTRSGAARRGRSPTSARTGATSSSSSRASESPPCVRRPRPSCPSAPTAGTRRRSRRRIAPAHPARAGRS
jgi:predicted dehydrogenase